MKKFLSGFLTVLVMAVAVAGCALRPPPEAYVPPAPEPALYGAPEMPSAMPAGYRSGPSCPPGFDYIRETRSCDIHITDRAQIDQVSPPVALDPDCQYPGQHYDKQILIHGRPAVAHQICGERRL